MWNEKHVNIIISIKNVFKILTWKMSSSGGIRANRLGMDCPTLNLPKSAFTLCRSICLLFIFPSEECILIESFSFYKYTINY